MILNLKKNQILLLKVKPSAYSSFLFWRIIPLHFYGERPKSHDIPKRMYTYGGKLFKVKQNLYLYSSCCTFLLKNVTGKFTDFSRVCVIRNIFIRKLSHLTISSPFILINQKMHKNHSSFWIDFCCYSLSSYAPACRHFCHLLHGFFR